MSIDAMKHALEALEDFLRDGYDTHSCWLAVGALRLAIEQAEQQEPVAWQWLNTAHFRKKLPRDAERGAWNALYTATPQRLPLTDEEIGMLTTDDGWSHCDTHALALFARAIERVHGIGGKQ